ncbi:MAG: type II toxin-antitoxin system RelE/ParE family toxin [Candidatus Magnetobacterium sp. LHC-1]|uniref:Type II toxin-antitoxin system RelE/ParE family toxin n=1 Tax=Candidatus Magnetobacterium casense TaxID=1455061 RepID=A0ABS6RVY0_9BACT|nr:type II toxin-antitoxin system RelE/ParE family toxin [Candidatus Magnetobacterium casensis]MBF0608012.1 type II toxin-antitoxin system RelE/ParE family toxin [Nitrospirota bacterium]MBV6340787.1 type II toxin-antitoxin system RelE/ParE family toxin [Candidatus Magnetobacterium casensis]
MYKADVSERFLKDLKRIKTKFNLQERLEEKIEKILENPYHYKPLRNALKSKRRSHIGSYVLIFEIRQEEHTVVFHSFQHHNEAYKSDILR